jgi:predicted transcriptional regulator
MQTMREENISSKNNNNRGVLRMKYLKPQFDTVYFIMKTINNKTLKGTFCTRAELKRTIKMCTSTMSRTEDWLVEAKLVERIKQGKYYELRTTPKGQNIMDAMQEIVGALNGWGMK